MERILAVDDEIEVCNVLKEFFDSKGYETHIVLRDTLYQQVSILFKP